jgi:hypothetical protein
MAFNKSTQAAFVMENIGSFSPMAMGMSTMASGGATVTIPGFTVLEGIVGIVQGATGVGEIVNCTATSGNTATIETVDESGSKSGSSVVMWIAWGQAKV